MSQNGTAANRRAERQPLKILICILYYFPHRTGMQLYIQRISEELVRRGHQVTILTARHNPTLVPEEMVNGVRVVRLWAPPIPISRGMIMPAYPLAAARLIAEHDVVSIHTPMLETALIAWLADLLNKPVVATHHGDLILPKGATNRLIQTTMFGFYRFMAEGAARLIAYTQDYADHSYYLLPYRHKVSVVYPPITMPLPNPHNAEALRHRWSPDGAPLIGFAGRFVEEKRPDLLIRALDTIHAQYPKARIVFAGEYDIKYENTWEKYQPLVERYREHLIFLGLINDMQTMADFFAAIDVLALSSDSECFALVQVEAMLSGTPVVMTDTPGARVPVQVTGMGRLAQPGDPRSIGEAVVGVLREPERYRRPRAEIEAIFSFQQTVDQYEGHFRAAAEADNGGASAAPALPVRGDGTVDPATIRHMTRNEADMAFRKRVQTIFEWLPPHDDSLILDCACGRGFYLNMYRYVNGAVRLVGLELEDAIIRKAQANVGHLPQVMLNNANIYSLPYPDNTFDGVILSEILEHIDHDVAGLREVYRVLKPGGVVAITVPNANYPFWWDPINKTLETLFGTHISHGMFAGLWANHVRLYTRAQLREAALAAGFVVEEERAFTHHAFPFIHNLVYGIGKPLLESGVMPAKMANAADRTKFSEQTDGGFNPITFGIRILNWFDRRNVISEPPGRPTVNLALKGRKPR